MSADCKFSTVSKTGKVENFQGNKFEILEMILKNVDDQIELSLKICFENAVFNETDDYYYVDISGDFYCLYSDEIVINVTTDYAVLDSNAAKVNGNKYTWIIDNKYNDGIHFVVSKTVISNNSEDTDGSNVFRIIAFIVLIILSGVTYFLYKKKNNG